jgi:hypothetical protein
VIGWLVCVCNGLSTGTPQEMACLVKYMAEQGSAVYVLRLTDMDQPILSDAHALARLVCSALDLPSLAAPQCDQVFDGLYLDGGFGLTLLLAASEPVDVSCSAGSTVSNYQ